MRALLSKPSDPNDPEQVVEHLIRLFGVIGSPGYPTDQGAPPPVPTIRWRRSLPAATPRITSRLRG